MLGYQRSPKVREQMTDGGAGHHQVTEVRAEVLIAGIWISLF